MVRHFFLFLFQNLAGLFLICQLFLAFGSDALGSFSTTFSVILVSSVSGLGAFELLFVPKNSRGRLVPWSAGAPCLAFTSLALLSVGGFDSCRPSIAVARSLGSVVFVAISCGSNSLSVSCSVLLLSVYLLLLQRVFLTFFAIWLTTASVLPLTIRALRSTCSLSDLVLCSRIYLCGHRLQHERVLLLCYVHYKYLYILLLSA